MKLNLVRTYDLYDVSPAMALDSAIKKVSKPFNSYALIHEDEGDNVGYSFLRTFKT